MGEASNYGKGYKNMKKKMIIDPAGFHDAYNGRMRKQ